MKTLNWESIPNLNSEERQRPMLELYKDNLFAFMGYTQNDILDSVERININKLDKWEKLSISNPDSINLKLYGAGIYNISGELYFFGGKFGQGFEEDDYKTQLYRFYIDKKQFTAKEIQNNRNLSFIENKFHYCCDDILGNFSKLCEGCLTTIYISDLLK